MQCILLMQVNQNGQNKNKSDFFHKAQAESTIS